MIVKVADLLTEPSAAVTVIVSAVSTFGVAKVYVPVVAPAGTVSVVPAGTVVPSELESEMETPLGPAIDVNETLAVKLAPP